MNTNEVEINIPETRETLIKATRNGMPEILSANQSLLRFPHTPIFPWHLSVVVTAQDVAVDGMPTAAEGDVLMAIGDEIENTVLGGRTATGALNALFLVRSTWNGFRELEFYIHDPDIAHAALQALTDSRDWPRGWNSTLEQDPDWEKATPVFKLLPQASA